jgi:acylphosphatase
MAAIAREVTVHGRVQGVWFRDSCRQEAVVRRVAGWVINQPDGTVAAFFEGEPDDVDAMVAWCHTGPPRASVIRVDASDATPQGRTSFEIL